MSTYTSGDEPYTANLRLAFKPDGALCLIGLHTPIADQTAGGLLGTNPTDPGISASWSCLIVPYDPESARIKQPVLVLAREWRFKSSHPHQ